MNLSPARNILLAIAVLVAATVAGGLFGGAQAESRPSEEALRNFGQILALIEDNYVGELDSEELVENAIQGMLTTLDPHSNFLNRDTFTEMRDEQRGSFHGLGIQINKPGPDKPLTIIAPIEDTPAFRAGLQAGDVIYKIEGDETSNLTLHEAVRRLKGEKGTEVTITVQRPAEGTAFDVTLERDEIPTHSIRVAYMLEPGTGFIRVSNFTSTTAQELDQKVRELTAQGMQRLILDLRSNPGGLLEQAFEVSKRFVPPGKMVVFTQGRTYGSQQDYVAPNDSEPLELPLVVLLDRHSASASEIVAGAIQDHDRGLLVGERTFGKGLVQRVIPLRSGAALALTTAKYYTPSGRLIQRDYSDLDGYFLDMRDPDEEPLEVAPVEPIEEDREVYYTDAGRPVFGGGGISPDYVVPSQRASNLMSRLMRENMIFDFAVLYADRHPRLEAGFALPEESLGQFKEFLAERGFEYGAEAFDDQAQDIMRQVRASISKILWGEDAEARVLAEGDPQIQQALVLFDEAGKLSEAGEQGRKRKARLDSERIPSDG